LTFKVTWFHNCKRFKNGNKNKLIIIIDNIQTIWIWVLHWNLWCTRPLKKIGLWTTWKNSYYWSNKPNYISIIIFEINENLSNIPYSSFRTFSWIYHLWETYLTTFINWNRHWKKNEVAKILGSWIFHGHLEYLVDWRGYDVDECTWELAFNWTNALQKVWRLHQQYPFKPRLMTSPSVVY
jgi:hypothetical protein